MSEPAELIPGVVRVSQRFVLAAAHGNITTLEVERDHAHWQAKVGRWIVELDGDGNLVVHSPNPAIEILRVKA